MKNKEFKTFNELSKVKFNTAIVTYSSESLPGYTKKERSYEFTSDNNYFNGGKISNSIVGHCLDCSETIRLDYYIENWKIESIVIVD